MFFRITSILGGIFAILCVAAWPLWILGTPGRPDAKSPYVRGWKASFNVITIYPGIWALNRGARGLIGRSGDALALARWQRASEEFGALLLLAPIASLAWALKTLGRNK